MTDRRMEGQRDGLMDGWRGLQYPHRFFLKKRWDNKSRCKKKQISLRNVRDGLLLPGQRRLWSANTFILKLLIKAFFCSPNYKIVYIVVMSLLPSLLEEEIYNHYR